MEDPGAERIMSQEDEDNPKDDETMDWSPPPAPTRIPTRPPYSQQVSHKYGKM